MARLIWETDFQMQICWDYGSAWVNHRNCSVPQSAQPWEGCLHLCSVPWDAQAKKRLRRYWMKRKWIYFLTFSQFYEVGERVACASAGIFPGVCVRTSNREYKLVLEIIVVGFCCCWGFFFSIFMTFIRTFQISNTKQNSLIPLQTFSQLCKASLKVVIL